jgi:hypothetical protein
LPKNQQTWVNATTVNCPPEKIPNGSGCITGTNGDQQQIQYQKLCRQWVHDYTKNDPKLPVPWKTNLQWIDRRKNIETKNNTLKYVIITTLVVLPLLIAYCMYRSCKQL